MNCFLVSLRTDGKTYTYDCATREAALVLFKALCVSHKSEHVAMHDLRAMANDAWPNIKASVDALLRTEA